MFEKDFIEDKKKETQICINRVNVYIYIYTYEAIKSVKKASLKR